MINRLTAQVGGNRSLAIGLLKKRGHLSDDGKAFTDEGAKRNMMTAEERAKSRAAKLSGRSESDYDYNAEKNTVKLRR